jgi:hypothetical protein
MNARDLDVFMRIASSSLTAGESRHALTFSQQLVEELGKLPLMFQPGTSWEYGRSIDVLLALVEKISGQRDGVSA